MPRLRYLVYRRMGPLGVALTVWDLWRRIPPKHRRKIIQAATRRGPTVAEAVRKRASKRRRP